MQEYYSGTVVVLCSPAYYYFTINEMYQILYSTTQLRYTLHNQNQKQQFMNVGLYYGIGSLPVDTR